MRIEILLNFRVDIQHSFRVIAKKTSTLITYKAAGRKVRRVINDLEYLKEALLY